MELRIILSEDEQKLLHTEQAEYGEPEVLSLLFDADNVLQRVAERMEQVRGHTAGQRAALNTAQHDHTVLTGLIQGLHRVAGIDTEIVR